MQPIIYEKYKKLIAKFLRIQKGYVLEIGCPSDPKDALLGIISNINPTMTCVGIDMLVNEANNNTHSLPYKLHKCNSNDMTHLFEDDTIDVILCSSVLEHDQYFWNTLKEIRRILKPGGLFFVGIPSYSKQIRYTQQSLLFIWKVLWKLFGNIAQKPLLYIRNSPLLASTLTYSYHFGPHDFYRFSEDAVRKVLFEGFELLHMEYFLSPPRILGVGRRLNEK